MSFRHRLVWLSLVSLLFLGACTEHGDSYPDDWTGVCIDQDGDGYGFQCTAGSDCDDRNRDVHECGPCDNPSEGCVCPEGAEPVACSLPYQLTRAGGLVCTQGTRYCRDGVWTECEGVATFEAPPPSDLGLHLGALLPADGGHPSCGVCDPDCYQVKDPLAPGDYGDAGVISTTNGVTLPSVSTAPEGGVIADAGVLDQAPCTQGQAPDSDCDGVPDVLETSPIDPPFATSHDTIVMDLAPGESGVMGMNLKFVTASADVYFYLDMTDTMEDERLRLIADLTTGSHLNATDAALDCADRDFNGLPDNYLKSQGIAGNIACLLRDAWFGAGWFRDIPFGKDILFGGGYGAPDLDMFTHKQDITPDVPALLAALKEFKTRASMDYPEGSMQGLWAIATGGEVYAGWDRAGVAARTDCPVGRFGYPCFRPGTVPIVVHITDAEFHSGPTTSLDYETTYISSRLRNGTGSTYYTLTPASGSTPARGESFSTPQDVGIVDGKLLTYAGDTSRMSSDVLYSMVGSCPAGQAWDPGAQSGKDAVFKFRVNSKNGTSDRDITLSARGTRFDSTLLVVRTSAVSPSTNISAADNPGFESPVDLGTLTSGQRYVAAGSTAAHAGMFNRQMLSTPSACFAGAGATSDDIEPGAVFKFRLAAPTSLRFLTTAGYPINGALFKGPTLAPTVVDLNTINCGGGPNPNCNDTPGRFSVESINGAHYHLVNGNTADTDITSNYSALEITAAGCSSAAAAPDAVVDFSVATKTRVRLETGGTNSTMSASFDHHLAIVRRQPPVVVPVPPVAVSANGDQSSAYTFFDTNVPSGASAGSWATFTGNSSADMPSYEQSDVGGNTPNVCHNGNVGAPTSAKDMVFKFQVNTPGTFEFDTTPAVESTGYKTWLSLHKNDIDRTTTRAISNTSELDTQSGQAVATLEQGSIDGRLVVLTGGQMEQRAANHVPWTRPYYSTTWHMGEDCGEVSSGNGGRDAVFRFRANASGSVSIRTVDATGTAGTVPGFDSFFAVYRGSIDRSNLVSGDCPEPSYYDSDRNNQPGNGWSKDVNVQAGYDYFIVVKEWKYSSLSSTTGKFGLRLEHSGYAGAFLGCDAGSAANPQYSRLLANLGTGTHYLVIKGTGAGTNHSFALKVRRPTTTGGTLLSCRNADAARRSFIEADLDPGEYSAVVKGRGASTTKGLYSLTMRDLSAAPMPLACHNTASAASFEQTSLPSTENGQPIDYYLVTRGNASNGNYQLVIEDKSFTTPVPTGCDDNNASAARYPEYSDRTYNGIDPNYLYDDAEMKVRLPVGDYYAVLKGRNESERGAFQFTVGETPVETTTSFAPKKWATAGVANGVKAALLDKGIHVITVNSTYDSSVRSQARAISSGTGAVNSSLSPLTFEIGSNGAGLGTSIVEAISQLVKNFSFNMSVQLVGNPTPGFQFKVQAVAAAGNGCDPPVDTAPTDGVPDTHMRCRPGATPTFNVTFTNPLSAPVPSNPSDPNGGYHMKLQLIGSSSSAPTRKYILDEIPAYIIPENRDVLPNSPSTQLFAQTGSYEQTTPSECTGTLRPRWSALTWDATLPAGTKVVWEMCAGDTDMEVATCSLKTAGIIEASTTAPSVYPCTSAAQCPAGGYCHDASDTCHAVSGPVCVTGSTDFCGTLGSCPSGVCRWQQSPSRPSLDPAPVLTGGMQGKSRVRVRATMHADATRKSAPTIHSWGLEYRCVPNL